MTKKASDGLFNLIQSLTKAEKRYFRIFAGQRALRTGQVLIRLYDAINRQKSHDNEKIRILFNHLGGNHFSSLKNILYNYILKYLRLHHSGMSVETAIRQLLHNADILYEKSLLEKSREMIVKARALAIRFHYPHAAFEILRKEMNATIELRDLQYFEKHLDATLKETERQFGMLKNQFEYYRIQYRMFPVTVTVQRIRSKADLLKYRAIMNLPMIRDHNHAIAFHSINLYYRININFYYAKEDWVKHHLFSQKAMQHVERKPHLLRENLVFYIAVLYSYSISLYHLGKYDIFLQSIHKARTAVQHSGKKSFSVRVQIMLFTIHNLEIDTYIKTGEFSKGIALIPAIQNGIKEFGFSVPRSQIMTSYYNIFYLHFGMSDYAKALASLNIIINYRDAQAEEYIHSFARVVNLILHFELGDWDLLEYLVKSTYRFLYKRSRLYRFEHLILDFFQYKFPVVNPHVKSEFTDAFTALRNKLAEISKDPFEKKALEYFDFISWLESKISGKPFAEIVREKAMEGRH